MNTLIAVVLAYLLGSVSFAVVVSKLMGLSDPRTYGSKNPGATNVLRSGNKAAAILTLLGDAVKGWLAVWLAQHYANAADLSEAGIALVGLAAFIGHLWPVFFRFIGGKGVATAAGVLIGIQWQMGLGVLAVWLLVAFATRYSSLAALIAAASAPMIYGMVFGSDVVLLAIFIMSGLLIYRHRQNIANLMSGKESKIGSKKKA
ncbi:glycerol-3-phosphate 1-O-acyltransferase PlsY [Undibacterium luofuense]|uniref:Glycerol-3-phosphate acyltransferase n=1 Tax=Undibacterium luofuense TaxID=2828733 RepID=A0A941DMR9_9BURK|nr:glycerol-3-phosphate 1-O-acyltransferase PlsY [Undibacterium luofuense]MBR7783748.1 glycerol-3-phosphate 1-O-acyltransferase PlsY [Undibacterium luofuense]